MAIVTGLFLVNALLPHPQVWALFVLQSVAIAIYSLGRPALGCVVGTRRAGDADGSRPVAQMPAKLTLDGAADVCGQQLGATGIAPVDRADDRERRHLRQVVAFDTASCKAPRGAARQRQVLLDQSAPLGGARDVGCHRDDATPRSR